MKRISSIDATRGLVMLLMLVDHTREFFFFHAQVSDPVDISTTSPSLFFTRFCAHLCAPVFVGLTGLSAWLYSQSRNSKRATSEFLLKRGLFLILLELTLINFGWSFSINPPIIFLQVIWAIGLSMMTLSGIIWLPARVQILVGLLIVFTHNLLDPISFAPTERGHALWAIIHDRSYVDLFWGAKARTSYPILPWIGLMTLGYTIGPWFSKVSLPEIRAKKLLSASLICGGLFITLRSINGYGEPLSWSLYSSGLRTIMSYLNLTKYPPSLDFLLITVGLGFLILWLMEKLPTKVSMLISIFGSAPMFFYLLHIYILNILNTSLKALLGPNVGMHFSLPNVFSLWVLSAGIAVPLWFACRWFSKLKRESKHPLLSYF